MSPPLGSLMVRVLLRPLVAMLQLMAVYVFLHGHHSPGGAFQAGVLLASSVLLPFLVHHSARSRYIIVSERGGIILASSGVLFATLVGAVPLVSGEPFLDYAHLPLNLEEAAKRSTGILLFELGVTVAVTGVIVAVFHALSAENEEP